MNTIKDIYQRLPIKDVKLVNLMTGENDGIAKIVGNFMESTNAFK